MPRTLTTLVERFASEANQALEFVQDAEEMCLPKVHEGDIVHTPLHYTRIEYLYELSL